MYSLTNQRIPENLNITVSKDNVTEDFKVTPEDEKKLEKAISRSIRKKRRSFKLKVVVSPDKNGDEKIVFHNAKDLMLAYTGTYDRYVVATCLKLFINDNLLPGKKPISHLWRVEKDTDNLIEF